MHLERLEITKDTKVMHLAPEQGIYHYLRDKLHPDNYHCFDFSPGRYKFCHKIDFIDLCNIDRVNLPDNTYDIIIHSHVLEHTPCNMAYTLYHLHRALKINGVSICCIPFMYGYWDESFSNLPESERVRRFGQHDHVRRIGRADRELHLGKIIKIPERYSLLDYFGQDKLIENNIPECEWSGFNINTVMLLGKLDYLLC